MFAGRKQLQRDRKPRRHAKIPGAAQLRLTRVPALGNVVVAAAGRFRKTVAAPATPPFTRARRVVRGTVPALLSTNEVAGLDGYSSVGEKAADDSTIMRAASTSF